jgi:multidrug efflux pump subunit AcrA (membrane-fusion protein)
MNRKAGIFLAMGFLVIIIIIAGFIIVNKGNDSDFQTKVVAGEQQTQLWTCGMDPDVIMPEPGNCPKCGMKLVPVKNTGMDVSTIPQSSEEKTSNEKSQNKKERKILYWQAPMDPTEIYDHPGKSKMGMDLIPVYEDQAGTSSTGAVIIDPATVQNMGVLYTTVRRMDFSRNVRAVGMIKYNEERLYSVNTKISGWIEKLYVDYTGQVVQKGQPLLEIYSPDLVTTQEEYLLALNNKQAVNQSSFASIRDGAESLLNSTRQRLDYWDIPPSEIEHLEITGKVSKTLQLNAPASGIVTHKNAVEGLHVSAGMDLYKIVDLSTIWVEASIYDYELPWIQKGQEAKADLSYLPDKSYEGKISYIYPYLDEKSRTITVRLEFSNPDLELKPGMYANVNIKGKTIPDALVIPNEAIIRSGVRNVVFVSQGEGRFEPRGIKIGEEGGSNNQYVRVISGLFENEKIVTSAQFMLDSESRLQEAIQKMLADQQNQSKPMETPEKKLQQSMPGMKDGSEMKNMDNHSHEKEDQEQSMQM